MNRVIQQAAQRMAKSGLCAKGCAAHAFKADKENRISVREVLHQQIQCSSFPVLPCPVDGEIFPLIHQLPDLSQPFS